MNMNAAVIYWSKTGNTEKVAQAIQETLEANDVQVTYKRVLVHSLSMPQGQASLVLCSVSPR